MFGYRLIVNKKVAFGAITKCAFKFISNLQLFCSIENLLIRHSEYRHFFHANTISAISRRKILTALVKDIASGGRVGYVRLESMTKAVPFCRSTTTLVPVKPVFPKAVALTCVPINQS